MYVLQYVSLSQAQTLSHFRACLTRRVLIKRAAEWILSARWETAAGSCSCGKYSSKRLFFFFLSWSPSSCSSPSEWIPHLHWPPPVAKSNLPSQMGSGRDDTVGRGLLKIDALLIKGARESESKAGDVEITKRSERRWHGRTRHETQSTWGRTRVLNMTGRISDVTLTTLPSGARWGFLL